MKIFQSFLFFKCSHLKKFFGYTKYIFNLYNLFLINLIYIFMKSLNEFVNESSKDEFNEHIKSHQQCYNKLLKWYDSCVGKYMNKDEAISCMKYAITQWENDNFDDM